MGSRDKMDQQHPHFHSVTVSEAEYRVLCCIGLEGGLADTEHVVSLAAALWRPGPISAADYASATATCEERGWIKVIMEEDRRADAARWADEPHQALGESPYYLRSWDFTPVGWRIFTQMIQQRHGVSREARYAESVQCLWEVPGRVSLLSVTENALLRELDEVLAGTDDLTVSDTGRGLREQHILGEISGPYPIGPWWVNRFYQALAGYRLDIAFEPADLHAETVCEHDP